MSHQHTNRHVCQNRFDAFAHAPLVEHEDEEFDEVCDWCEQSPCEDDCRYQDYLDACEEESERQIWWLVNRRG